MILVFPWSSRLTVNPAEPNPKDYPHWEEVVGRLIKRGFDVRQVSRSGEPAVPGVSGRHDDLTLEELKALVRACDTFVSVDSFGQHLAWSVGKRGVVIFGQSDPGIFGHPENVNLLKSRRYLREKQYWLWGQTPYIREAFVAPEEVEKAVLSLLKRS